MREAVIERDGEKCVICASTTHLQVDHIAPLSRKGENTWSNLWTLCKLCHEAKTGRRLG
ncbi:MAG: HNH endonuclease [Thermoplasmatota archaeon]